MTAPLSNADRLFVLIEEAARAGRMAPTNREICSTFGLSSVSTATGIVSRLERAGRIKVIRYQADRVIEIPQLGLATAKPASAARVVDHSSKGTWTAEREDLARQLAAARTPAADAADRLGVSVKALHAKAARIGLSFGRLGATVGRASPRPKPPKIWTAERLESVRVAADAGMTAAGIAATLGLSKDQVADGARKHGIRLTLAPRPPRTPARRFAVPVAELVGKCLPPSPPVVTDADGRQSPVPAMNMLAPAAPRKVVSFFRTCQWITGDPTCDDSCKCASPTAPGRPYCEGHASRAYIQPGTRTPDGRRVGASRDRMGLAV